MGIITVTGATGNVGRAVVEDLVKSGAQVRAAVRSPPRAAALAALGADVVELDYGKPETFARALDGTEQLLVVAPDGPEQAQQLEGFVADAARIGVRYLVKLSSLQAAPTISLARWNREADEMIARSGIASTVLRPNSFMQNLSRMLGHAIRSDGVVALPFGTGRVSWIDARDVAAVAAALLAKPAHLGESLDLTGPVALTTTEVAQIFTHALGRPITYVDAPPEMIRQAMTAMGMPPWAVSATAELFDACRQDQMAGVAPTVAQILGRAPISLDRFVSDHRSAFS